MKEAARDRILIFHTGEHEIRVDPETLQTLAHDVFEQLPRPLATNRVGVENSYTRRADGPGLQDGPAFLEDGDQRFQLRLGDGKRRTLHRGNPLPGRGMAELMRRGDDHAGGAVDLLEEFIVHQYAAVFRGQEVGPAARREADL